MDRRIFVDVYIDMEISARIIARGEEDIAETKRRAAEALKERLWREVWKDCVEVSGIGFEVRSLGGGYVEVTARCGAEKFNL